MRLSNRFLSQFDDIPRALKYGKDRNTFIAVLAMTIKPHFLHARHQHPPKLRNGASTPMHAAVLNRMWTINQRSLL